LTLRAGGQIARAKFGFLNQFGIVCPAIDGWIVASGDTVAHVVGAVEAVGASQVGVDTSDGWDTCILCACIVVIANGRNIDGNVEAGSIVGVTSITGTGIAIVAVLRREDARSGHIGAHIDDTWIGILAELGFGIAVIGSRE